MTFFIASNLAFALLYVVKIVKT